MTGPFQQGTKQQGRNRRSRRRSIIARRWPRSITACRDKFGGKAFADLADEQKDEVIKGLEDGTLKLDGTDSQDFFKLILNDTQNGFFADPIYGGNKDMASWKMIGFPGAHYDYRDWVDRHNERVHAAAGRHQRSSELDAVILNDSVAQRRRGIACRENFPARMPSSSGWAGPARSSPTN